MNVPQTTAEYTEKLRQALQRDTTLRQLAAQATTRYAGEKARIDRGLVLALNGHVTLHADGTASVQSGTDAEVVYTVNGHCDCPDARRAPEGRCKHRWAKCLVKRATQAGAVLHQHDPDTGPGAGWSQSDRRRQAGRGRRGGWAGGVICNHNGARHN